MTALAISGPTVVSPIVAVNADPFKDPRSGLEVAPPPGFTAEVQRTDAKGEDAITMQGGGNACVVDLVRRPACTRMVSEGELATAAHQADLVAALGPAESIRVGPLVGVLMEGPSKPPAIAARIHIAVLAYSAGRVFVACRAAPGDAFGSRFEAMVRSIRPPQ